MVDDDNDDSSTFQSLAGATTKLLSKIEQGQTNNANSREERGERQQAERAKEEHLRYIDRRLSDIASFEQRMNGGKGFQRRTGRRMKK